MWIRSQDGKILVDAKEIFIEGVYGTMIFCSTDSEEYLLGQYSTHEKALGVLDEIQCSITGNRFANNNYELVRDCPTAGTEFHGVYTMPKDDEVEV